jgi:hypothetical protein
MYMGTPFPSPPSSFTLFLQFNHPFHFHPYWVAMAVDTQKVWSFNSYILLGWYIAQFILFVCDSYVSKTLLYYTHSCGHVSIFFKLHQLFSRWGDKWRWQILYKGDINYKKCHLLIFLPIVGIVELCNRPGITKHYSTQSITNSTNPHITPYHTKLPLQYIHTLITLSL